MHTEQQMSWFCVHMRAPLSLHLTDSAILVGWQYTEESYQHSNHAVLTDSKMLETIFLELLPRRDKCDEQMTCTYNAEKHSMLHRCCTDSRFRSTSDWIYRIQNFYHNISQLGISDLRENFARKSRAALEGQEWWINK